VRQAARNQAMNGKREGVEPDIQAIAKGMGGWLPADRRNARRAERLIADHRQRLGRAFQHRTHLTSPTRSPEAAYRKEADHCQRDLLDRSSGSRPSSERRSPVSAIPGHVGENPRRGMFPGDRDGRRSRHRGAGRYHPRLNKKTRPPVRGRAAVTRRRDGGTAVAAPRQLDAALCIEA